MDRFGERSTFRVQLSNLDDADSPVTPTTLRYRIDCLTTGKEVLGWTSLTPDDTVEVTATADQNAIISRTNLVERRVMTFEADAGTSIAYVDDWEYEVRRLSGF